MICCSEVIGLRRSAECYALGLDPEDNSPTNDFRIVSIKIVNGVPHVEWEPKVNRWTGTELTAVLKGAAELDDEFVPVTEQNKSLFRFFKVTWNCRRPSLCGK